MENINLTYQQITNKLVHSKKYISNDSYDEARDILNFIKCLFEKISTNDETIEDFINQIENILNDIDTCETYDDNSMSVNKTSTIEEINDLIESLDDIDESYFKSN